MVPWAIVPTAGRGSRLLPATALVPKVLLPVGPRPMLNWSVEEAVAAGVEAIIFVVAPDQPLVREHVEMMRRPASPEIGVAELGRRLEGIDFVFVEQPSPVGLGDALTRCRSITGDDPFSVLLPDNWFDSARPAIAQVAETFERTGMSTIGLTEIERGEAALFGNVGGVKLQRIRGPSYRILALQDKQAGSFETAGEEGVLRGCARYVLDAGFYDALTVTGPPVSGEWDDVPAFQHLIENEGLAGHRLEGRHFDIGQPSGYSAAMVYLADKR